MKLVKIGDTWINMDYVMQIDERPSSLTLSFVGAVAGEEPYAIVVTESADIQALREWLKRSPDAEDATHKPPPRTTWST